MTPLEKKMHKNIAISIVILTTLLTSGCADTISFSEASAIDPVGFWYGLWHGIALPFSWIGSLIWDDIAIYAIYNNGGWYDFGFFLGLGGFTTSAASNR